MSICPKFLDLSPERRFSVMKRYSLCVNYLIGGHKLNEQHVGHGIITYQFLRNEASLLRNPSLKLYCDAVLI